MDKTETCLTYANSLNLNEEESLSLIRKNSLSKVNPENYGLFRFVSGKEAFQNSLFKHHCSYPGQKGDCGIYWATSYGKILGMASFNIHTTDDFLKIVQIQGTRAEYLSRIEKSALKMIPWEMSLINLVENVALETDFSSVRVISPLEINSTISESLDPKKITRRYSVPALQRGFFPDENTREWYKPLN